MPSLRFTSSNPLRRAAAFGAVPLRAAGADRRAPDTAGRLFSRSSTRYRASVFLHTPSFVGMKYSDDFILLEVAFIAGRPKETRLALLKELNARIVTAVGISPDDVVIQLIEGPGENFSFGQGLAQRASISRRAPR